jgi:ectoine hydroxylase-related dioxygenase (phytanoyl-CoA dioxygenase family)
MSVETFRQQGWIVVRAGLGDAEVARLTEAVDEIERWAHDDGPGLHHFEQTEHGPALARSERLVEHSTAIRDLVANDAIVDTLGQLFGEPPTLFKEKINFKHPGGAGFAPHQDAPAYRFVDHHISCMVPVDPASEASGCLWVASGRHHGLLPADGRNRIADDVVDALVWEPVPLGPGDLLLFDSYTPHRSGTNTTDRPRRAAYLTYNAASRGDHRERYYADKCAEFAATGPTFDDERVRISISDDFLGRPVT